MATHQRDWNVRRIGEYKSDFLKHRPSAEVLCEEEPVYSQFGHNFPRLRAIYQPAPLSPKPWATIMVAVWRLSAGTTIGARRAIFLGCQRSNVGVEKCQRANGERPGNQSRRVGGFRGHAGPQRHYSVPASREGGPSSSPIISQTSSITYLHRENNSSSSSVDLIILISLSVCVLPLLITN